MSVSATYGAAALGVVQRDLRMFASYRGRFVTRVVTIFLSLALFYYVSRLVHVSTFSSPERYFGFAVVGIAALEVLTATLAMTPVAVRAELLAATFERLAVSPFGPVGSIASMTLFPTALALAFVVVTLGLACAVFGLDLHWATVPLAIPVALLAAMAFAPLTVLLCAAVLVAKQAGSGAAFVVSALSLAGGAFFPVGLLPGWLRWISDAQPLTPALELLRHLLLGTPMAGSVASDVLRLAAFSAALAPLALFVLQASVAACRRRGTLTEY